jgi:hypothetical protein
MRTSAVASRLWMAGDGITNPEIAAGALVVLAASNITCTGSPLCRNHLLRRVDRVPPHRLTVGGPALSRVAFVSRSAWR